MREQCIEAINTEHENIDKEFPKYENLTEDIFEKLTDFANEDFEGISDNKRYRYFLDLCRDILTEAFERDAQKSYLRMVFKALKNEDISKYFSRVMQSRSNNFKFVIDRLWNAFVYEHIEYQKDRKLKEILDLLNAWY